MNSTFNGNGNDSRGGSGDGGRRAIKLRKSASSAPSSNGSLSSHDLNLPVLDCPSMDSSAKESKFRSQTSRWMWTCHNFSRHTVTHSGPAAAIIWFLATLLVVFIPLLSSSSSLPPPNSSFIKASPLPPTITASKTLAIFPPLSILDNDNERLRIFLPFGNSEGPSSSSFSKFHLEPIPVEAKDLKHNYGGLHYDPKYQRKRIDILPKKRDLDQLENYREELLEDMDSEDISRKYWHAEELEDVPPQKCRSLSWHNEVHPTCNVAHELTLERVFRPENLELRHQQDFNVTYLSSGAYRDAWRFQRRGFIPSEFVLKRLQRRDKFKFTFYDLAKIQKEAMIFEQLSSAPLILDMYGYCGGSVVLEPMASDLHRLVIPGDGQYSQSKLDQLPDPSRNGFTASQKLQIALEMAESLAAMHGHVGGPIIHQDTHPEQWLFDRDGTAKLNDFNNAILPAWNVEQNDYCTRRASYGGIYSSPEEFAGQVQDEGADTYSYGNNIYTLLTGLWPFYATVEHKHSEIRKWVKEGKRPYVDPRFRSRSFIEGKLVDIMEQCWEHERTKRISMFSVVQFLRRVKSQAIEKGEFVLPKPTTS